MPKWEHQTIVVRQVSGADLEHMAVVQINGKDTEFTGNMLTGRHYEYDLPAYLGQQGQDGWEVASMATLLSQLTGMTSIVVVLKRQTS